MYVLYHPYDIIVNMHKFSSMENAFSVYMVTRHASCITLTMLHVLH